MADENVSLFGIATSAKLAEAALAGLEEKLGTTIDKSDGLEKALVAGTRALKEQEAQARKFRDALEEAATGAKQLADEEKAANEARKQQEKDAAAAAARAEKAANTARAQHEKSLELFAKGGFGGEMAERLKSVREGFKLAGDASASTGDRFRAFVGAVGVAARGAAGLAMQLVQLAKEANDAAVAIETQQRQLRALGDGYETVREATNGTLSASEAFAEQQAATQHHLTLTTEQFAALARAAREFAQPGQSARESFEQLAAAIESGDREALAHYAVTLERTGTGAQNLASVTDALARAQQSAAPAARTAAEETEQVNAAWTRLGQLTLQSVPPVQLAAGAYRALGMRLAEYNDTLTTTATDEERVRRVHQLEAQNVAGLTALHNHWVDAMKHAGEAMAHLKTSSDLLNTSLQAGELPVDRLVRRLQGASMAINEARALRGENRAIVRQLAGTRAADGHVITSSEAARAVGYDQGTDTVTPLRRQLSAAVAESKIVGATDVEALHLQRERDARTHQLESLQHFLTRQIEMQRAFNETRRSLLDDDLAVQQEQARSVQELERQKSVDERMRQTDIAEANDALEGEKALHAKQQEEARSYYANMKSLADSFFLDQATQAQTAASVVAGAFGTMKAAFQSHLAAVIEGRETIAEAMRGMVHDILLSLASEAAIQAIMETAKGIAKLAASYGTDVSAAGHFAAAAAYGIVATGAGLGAYATNPSKAVGTGSASSGGPSRAVSTGGSAGAASGGNVTYVYQFNGAVYDPAGMRGVIANAQAGNNARGTQPAYERRAA